MNESNRFPNHESCKLVLSESGCRRKHHPDDLWWYVIYRPYNLRSLPLLVGRTQGWPQCDERALFCPVVHWRQNNWLCKPRRSLRQFPTREQSRQHFFLPFACPPLGSSFASGCCYRRVDRGEFSARKSINGFSSCVTYPTHLTPFPKIQPLVKRSSNKEVKWF